MSGRWRPAVRIARSILKNHDEDGASRHHVWHIARAAVDASLSSDNAADVISAFRKLLGDDDYLMGQLGFVRAAEGDVDGVLEVVGVEMAQVVDADEDGRLIVAFALLVSGRGAEAYPLFKSLQDPADELYPALVESALAAGDVDGAKTALQGLAGAEGQPGRVAAIAMKLLERIEQADYATTFGALVAGTRSPYLVSRATTPVVQPQAAESTWEGVHRRTSDIMAAKVSRMSLN